MTTHPTVVELLRAVRTWLESDGATGNAYMTLVARNALAIVQRELELGPASDADAHARLQKLLNMQSDLPTLETELCARLRNGTMSADTPGLLLHVRKQTLDRLAIDQPRYRHELKTDP